MAYESAVSDICPWCGKPCSGAGTYTIRDRQVFHKECASLRFSGERLYTQSKLDEAVRAAVEVERAAAAEYCWQKYKRRNPLNLESPAIFTSHEHRKIVEHMRAAAIRARGETK